MKGPKCFLEVGDVVDLELRNFHNEPVPGRKSLIVIEAAKMGECFFAKFQKGGRLVCRKDGEKEVCEFNSLFMETGAICGSDVEESCIICRVSKVVLVAPKVLWPRPRWVGKK